MTGRKSKYNFTPYERPYGTGWEPYILINASTGFIFFSHKFMVVNKLGKYGYVQLFVDERKQAVAFRFHSQKVGHSYKIKREKRMFNLSGLINSKAFVTELVKKGWFEADGKSWYFTPLVYRNYRKREEVDYVIELKEGYKSKTNH